MYQELSPTDRENRLKAHAYCISEEELPRYFSAAEREVLKNELVAEDIYLMDLDEEKKKFLEEINARIKDHKESQKIVVGKLRKNYVRELTQVALIDDQEEGLMNYYDLDGKFIQSRKLRPEERQTKLRAMTGTND